MLARYSVINAFERPTVFAVIFAALISALTYSHLGIPIRPGPDGSYQYAFNFFFANDVQIGKDILFTYGPFGFLLWPQFNGNNLLIASIVSISMKFSFVLASLFLNYRTKTSVSIISNGFIIGITFLVALQISLHNLLIFLPVVLLLLHNFSGKSLPLVLACIVVSFALMVKASSGILSLLALASYVLITGFRDRKIQCFTVVFLTLSLVCTVTWFFLYQNFGGFFDYFKATLEFSVGNSSAMSLNPENNWWFVSGFIICFFVMPFILKDKNIIFLYMVLMFTGVAFFKYAISREDHLGHLLYYLFQFLYLVFVVSLSIEKKHLIGAAIVFIALLLFINSSPYKSSIPRFYESFLISFFDKKDVSFETHTNDLANRSSRVLGKRLLDSEILSLVGDRSIDSYPWDTIYIAANQLNWRPRPVIQSYITYTPYLDQKNEEFFRSENAPEFLLWEKSHFGGELGSIDGRHLFNDEPLTLLAILTHYFARYETADHILLQRAVNPRLAASSVSLKKPFKWREWIDIPSDKITSRDVFRAQIFIERTIFQKIKMLVYKEFDSYITYKFKNGEERKYRLIVDNARSGVWINPSQVKLLEFDAKNDVVAIKLTHSKGDYFKSSFFVAWEASEWIEQ